MRGLAFGGVLLLLVGGCKAGPPGTNGTDGVNGTNGTNGTNGVDGTDGVNGTNGTNGTDGTNGYDGRDAHQGDAPWGVNLEILSVDGASGSAGAFQSGDTPSITFAVTDDDGIEYGLDELSGIWFDMAGPVTAPQIAYYSSDIKDVATASVDNHDGTYTYTFSTPIPSVYHAVPNDTPDLGVDDGDLGGQALVDGTYIIGGDAYITEYNSDGSHWYDAGDTTTHVLYGTATTLDTSAEVSQDNCAACHGDQGFRMHGGSRRSVELCRTCHVNGAEDRYSATDPTVTPKATVGFTSMVHKIHMGAALTNGYEVAGYPADSTATGYPNYNLVDFSDVEFPQDGVGAGISGSDLGASNCAACHTGATTPVDTIPSRLACGACHDNINFAETDSTAADYHPGGTMTSDAACTLCHTSTLIDGYHDDPRTDATMWTKNGLQKGINVTLLTAVNQDGDTAFEPGDTVTVTFSVLDDAGNPVPASAFAYSSSSSTCPTVSGGATIMLVGPSDHMQRVLYSQSAGKSSVKGAVNGDSTVDTSTGIWTYTFKDTSSNAQTIPSTFPYQLNDSAGGFGNDYGDLGGQALTPGTYRLTMTMYTTLWDDTSCGSTATRYRNAASSYMDVLVGGATDLEPHAVVADANCESCHGRVEFHGSTRADTTYCTGCHTPGATDSSTAPLTTIDFAVVIHNVHGNQVQDNPWSITGFTGISTYDFAFPRQDGGVAACEACHAGSDAYLQPSAQKCMTCHNGDDAKAHAAIMTDDVYGESCDVCHGPDGDFSVASVHAFTH